jgi:hypothetical protein
MTWYTSYMQEFLYCFFSLFHKAHGYFDVLLVLSICNARTSFFGVTREIHSVLTDGTPRYLGERISRKAAWNRSARPFPATVARFSQEPTGATKRRF